jgi:integrase
MPVDTEGRTLTPHSNIHRKMKRGFYMSSIIANDIGAKCIDCAGDTFIKEMLDPKIKLGISKCANCGGHPDKIRIRRSLPIGQNGKAKRVDIRHARSGEKIIDIEEAKHVARSIDYDIKDGRFDPRDYRPRSSLDDLKFQNLIDNRYFPSQEKKVARGEMTPAGLKAKRSALNHIKAFFHDHDIRRIKSGMVFEFQESFESGPRARDLAIQELQVVMKFFLQMDYISELPKFPKSKKSKIRNVEKFLTDIEQEKIINEIEVPLYRLMIETLVIYAMRPCEVRALQWRDIDRVSGVVTIQRHFSDGIHLKDGRKSNEGVHYLPLTERFAEILNEIPRSLKKDDFIFKGKNGGAVADRVLARHWAKACKKLKIEKVELYEGTKHSRLSFLKRQGFSDDQLLHLSGHTNVETLKRYAQVTKLNKLEMVKEMIQ